MQKSVIEKISPMFHTFDGREKLVRIHQYFLHFLLDALAKRQKSLPTARAQALGHLISKLKIISDQAGSFRNMMYFGMYVPTFLKLYNRFQTGGKAAYG